MATNYDFRILIETVSGSQYSYGTGSFVSLDDTSVILTTSESAARIDNMPTMTYYNGKTFTTGSNLFADKGPETFSDTNLDGSSVDYQFVSCSIVGNKLSGSLKFSIPEALAADGDHTKRYKFFGNKVCSVLGLPENYWIYSDAFRLSNTASEVNYLSGDLLAQSVNVKHNFAISNAGSIETDLPFKHAKDSDRWIKWTDVSGSLPTNDMLMGYSNLSDRYMIRMQNNQDLIISSSAISASGDILATGDMFISNASPALYLNATNATDAQGYMQMISGKLLIYNNFDHSAADLELRTKSFDNAIYIDNSTQRIGIGTTTPNSKLEVNGDLKVTNITASGDISVSGDLHLDNNQSIIFGDGNTSIKESNDNQIDFTANSDRKLVVFSSGVLTDTGVKLAVNRGTIGSEALTVEGNISSSGRLFLSDGAMSSNSTTDFITLTGHNSDVTSTPQAMAIKFLSSDTNSAATASIRMAVVNATDYGDNDEDASNLIFATSNHPEGTFTDKMIITGRGDVGIGIDAPTKLLHVNGDFKALSYSAIEISTGNNVQYFKLGTLASDGARVVCEAIGQNAYSEPGTLITTGIFSIGNADNEYSVTQNSKGDYPAVDKEPTFIYKDEGTDTSIDVYIKCGTFFRGSVFIKEGYGFTLNAAAATAVSDPSGVEAVKIYPFNYTPAFHQARALNTPVRGDTNDHHFLDFGYRQEDGESQVNTERSIVAAFDGYVHSATVRFATTAGDTHLPGDTRFRIFKAAVGVQATVNTNYVNIGDGTAWVSDGRDSANGSGTGTNGRSVDMDSANGAAFYDFTDNSDSSTGGPSGDFTFNAGDRLAVSWIGTEYDGDYVHANLTLMYRIQPSLGTRKLT